MNSLKKIFDYSIISLKMIINDKKALLKAFLGCFLLIYPFLTFWALEKVTLLPAIINGFFLITPFIDYTFFISRHKNLYKQHLDKGFSVIQIILGKSFTILLFAILGIIINALLMILFNHFSLIHLDFDSTFLIKIFTFLPAIYGIILLEGMIQAFLGMLFFIRVMNMLIFILNAYFIEELFQFIAKYSIRLLLIGNLVLPIILILVLLLAKNKWLISENKKL